MLYESSLYHHGIKGMKWGVRRFQNENGRLTKAGKERYNKGEGKKGLSDKQKKALKIAAVTATTALAAYGTYRLYKSGKLGELVKAGKSKCDSLLDKNKSGHPPDAADISRGKTYFENKLGVKTGMLKRMSKPEPLQDTLKKSNPLRGTLVGGNNCTFCGIAGFLRRRGYDVVANSSGGKPQNLAGIVEECFKDAKVFDGTATKFGRSKQDAADMLLKRFGRDAEGVVAVQWRGSDEGHTFSWKIEEGLVSFFDIQQGESNVDWYFNKIDPNGFLQLVRLDGLEINSENIFKYVANA